MAPEGILDGKEPSSCPLGIARMVLKDALELRSLHQSKLWLGYPDLEPINKLEALVVQHSNTQSTCVPSPANKLACVAICGVQLVLTLWVRHHGRWESQNMVQCQRASCHPTGDIHGNVRDTTVIHMVVKWWRASITLGVQDTRIECILLCRSKSG